MRYIAIAVICLAALGYFNLANDAQQLVDKTVEDRCAAFAAAGIDC